MLLLNLLTITLVIKICNSADDITGEIPKQLNFATQCEKCLACLGVVMQLNDTFTIVSSVEFGTSILPFDVCYMQKKVRVRNFDGRLGDNISVLVSEYCEKIAEKYTTDVLFEKWLANSLGEICSEEEEELKSCDLLSVLKEFEPQPRVRWYKKNLAEIHRTVPQRGNTRVC